MIVNSAKRLRAALALCKNLDFCTARERGGRATFQILPILQHIQSGAFTHGSFLVWTTKSALTNCIKNFLV
jgi:hypothetical protein